MQILKSNLLKNEMQVILVYANSKKDATAKVLLCEKVNNMWKIIMQTKGYIGRNGLGKQIEGDLKTPIGLFDLGIAFGLHKNIKTKLDYHILNENVYWISDSNSKYYNQFVDFTKLNEEIRKDCCSPNNEHLIEETIAYEYAIEIRYNEKCIPGRGSAIFLHCIKNGPTAGCVSIHKNQMKFILEKVKKHTKIYIDYE